MSSRSYYFDVFGTMVPCDVESVGISAVRKFVIMHRKALGIEVKDMARFETDDDFLVESCRGYDQPDACVGIVGETVFPWTCRNAYGFYNRMAGLSEEKATEIILEYAKGLVPDAKCDRYEIEQYG